jgi:flavin reductase (DIM6/NTAB) family NADH-FMN oxidoreductase RutF
MDPKARQVALRKLPYGLFVIGLVDGDKVGAFTAAWISQCSFEPPLVMLAVKKGSLGHAMIEASRRFSVNVLAADQKEMAAHFFQQRPRSGNKLGAYAFTPGSGTGAPVLDEAPAFAECQVKQVVPAGDHDVVIAEVVAVTVRRDAKPLLLQDTGFDYYGG